MNEIVLAFSDETVNSVMAQVCIDIQKKYDISPYVVHRVANNKGFVTHVNFISRQMRAELIHKINQYNEQYHDVSQAAINGGEYEKCGHIDRTYPNGYVVYCNIHKYLHPQKTGDSGPNHYFKAKTYKEIIKEHHYSAIHIIYSNYINKLTHHLLCLFEYYLMDGTTSTTTPITADDITQMRNNPLIFRSKIAEEGKIKLYTFKNLAL